MLAALRETIVLGVTTNRDYLREILAHPAFAAGATHTEFLDEHLPHWKPAGGKHRDVAALVAALALGERSAPAQANGAEAAPSEPVGSARRVADRSRGVSGS